MAGFPKKERQRIIDEYLAASGRNMFVPHEFVDWLGGEPDHEAYEWFYGMDDVEADKGEKIWLVFQRKNVKELLTNTWRRQVAICLCHMSLWIG